MGPLAQDNMDIKFDFNDILITPNISSSIENRGVINHKYKDGFLPIVTAPMDMVISNKNEELFLFNNIRAVLPRGEKSNNPLVIESLSLNEIIERYDNESLEVSGGYLIDIANGHMEKLFYAVKIIKQSYPDLFLMVGNIANPETYRMLSEAGADAIRVGIGGGGSCSTTVHTGVGYAMGSLIKECYDISCTLDAPALIIADGGMKNYSDIIKALYLGADYVMVGGLFNRCIESAGDNYLFNLIKVPQWVAEWCFLRKLPIYKHMRGMSTKEVQKKWGKTDLKTSEGVTRRNKVEYSLSQWVEKFEDYLRSSMSYSGSLSLNDFKGKGNFTLISQNVYKRFNK